MTSHASTSFLACLTSGASICRRAPRIEQLPCSAHSLLFSGSVLTFTRSHSSLLAEVPHARRRVHSHSNDRRTPRAPATRERSIGGTREPGGSSSRHATEDPGRRNSARRSRAWRHPCAQLACGVGAVARAPAHSRVRPRCLRISDQGIGEVAIRVAHHPLGTVVVIVDGDVSRHLRPLPHPLSVSRPAQAVNDRPASG